MGEEEKTAGERKARPLSLPENIVWKPQEKQAQFMSRNEYEALYGGAAGGGKSDALLAEALRQVEIPHYRALILRKTFPQLSELIDRSQTIYKAAFPDAEYNISQHVWKFPSGAMIYFGSMAHPEDKAAYQGRRYDFIGFDELTHFTWAEYSYMFSRNRAGGKGTRVYMRATANPGGIGHSWVKSRFVTAGKPLETITSRYEVTAPDGSVSTAERTRVFVPALVFDNKRLLENSPEYLAALSMLPEAEKKALLYGDWNSFMGQVFSEWRDDPAHYSDGLYTHVIEPFDIPRDWRIIRGFDFGYSRPFSVGWYAEDTFGRLYRIMEYYGCTGVANEGLKLEPEKIAAEIRRIENGSPQLRGREMTGVADPSIFDRSRGESVADLMAKAPNFICWSPGDNTRIAGKMQMHHRLSFDESGRPMFYCFSTCKNFIRTVPSLCYSSSNIEDVDTAAEDHIYDECRYVMMERPVLYSADLKRVKRDINDPLRI